jgi:transposase
VAGWSAQRFLDWAATFGPQTQAAIEQVLASRVHPQQGYRTALGILRLGKTHGEERLEAACLRAIQIKAVTYRSIASILKHALERQTPTQVQANLPPDHANVRGSKYYH